MRSSMNTGWRIWFAFLIIAALYGLVMIGDAQKAAEINETGVLTVQQQTVAGVWQVADLAAIIVYELMVAVVAIASLGLYLISRDDPTLEVEADPPHGAHVVRRPSDDREKADKPM
jgi:hypothetical protein